VVHPKRVWISFLTGLTMMCPLPSSGSAAEPFPLREPLSSLHTYIPSAQPGSDLSSLTPHCEGCKVLVPDKTAPTRPRGNGFHRPPHLQGSRYIRLGSGKQLKLKPSAARSRPLQLPRRSLTRLGLTALHFEGWQVQAVDGDTIRYGTERVRLRGLNAPELSEPGGFEARQRLAELLSQGNIRLVPHGLDIYGRMLADVFISDRNVADIMTSEGFAKRG
jgi:micrococcal nuclease